MPPRPPYTPGFEQIDLEATLDAIELAYLELALLFTDQNKTEAARLLGLNQRSFRYRLRKLRKRPAID